MFKFCFSLFRLISATDLFEDVDWFLFLYVFSWLCSKFVLKLVSTSFCVPSNGNRTVTDMRMYIITYRELLYVLP